MGLDLFSFEDEDVAEAAMRTGAEARGVELLVEEGWRFLGEGRYADALRVAEQARAGAQRLADVGLEVRAARMEADALRMLGRKGDALTRYSWILGIAEDPIHRGAVAEETVAFMVVTAFIYWVESALFLPAMQVEQLFQVLDAGERFVRASGKPAWRAGLLRMRARVLRGLGRVNEAIGFAEEGLALQLRKRGAPGASLGAHRWGLGNMLREAGRFDDARRCFKAVLDDTKSQPYDRLAAHSGLVQCSLAAGDNAAARRFAEQAVRLAEPMGEDALSRALEALTDAYLAEGDLAAALATSDRFIELARKLGSAERLFHAFHRAALLAIAERDPGRARAHLAEARPHAEALDRARHRNHYRAKLDDVHAKLATLEPALAREPEPDHAPDHASATAGEPDPDPATAGEPAPTRERAAAGDPAPAGEPGRGAG